jgi:hypothetical protein
MMTPFKTFGKEGIFFITPPQKSSYVWEQRSFTKEGMAKMEG